MDQYASALGEAGHALRLDCEHLRHESVRFELGSAELWAVDSKAPRKLAGGVYNQRVAECAEIERLAGSNDWFAMTPDLPAPLDARLRHIQSEQARVIETCEVAEQGDLVRWGALMNESHRSLSQDYEVAGDAMDRLQAALSGSRGCYGARMTGGGFGGCVIALIERESVLRFSNRWPKPTGTLSGFLVPQCRRPNFMSTWEKRWHPLRQEWVIVSANTGARPWSGAVVEGQTVDTLSTILAVICARGSSARPAAKIRTIKAPMPLIMTFPHWRWMPRVTQVVILLRWVCAVFWSGIRAITIRWRA